MGLAAPGTTGGQKASTVVQYRVPLQLSFNRESSDGAGMQPPDALGCAVLQGAIDFGGAAFQLMMPLPRDATIVAAKIFFEGNDYDGTFESATGRTSWVTGGTGATDAVVANGGAVFTNDSRNVITIGGAAAALLADTSLQALAYYKLGPAGGVGITGVPSQGSAQPQWSSALVGAFADDALGDIPSLGDLRAMYARYENLFAGRGGGGSVVTLPTGVATVRSCDAAFADPWGRVLLSPSDVGSGPGQIPTGRRSWLGSMFDNHPQVFVRLSNKVRGLAAASAFGLSDLTPITGTPAMFRLYQVVRAPTHSTWRMVIDGQPQLLTFQHPQGSDLRRPVDIWNQVIVPAIITMGASGGPSSPLGTAAGVAPAITYEVDPGTGIYPVAAPVYPATAIRARGGLPRRLSFVSYARCVDLWDPLSVYDDPIYTEVPTLDAL